MGVKCVTGYTEIGSCAPNCENVDDGVAVSDPKNCQNFYICQHGLPSEFPVSCGDGEYFDQNSGECETGTCVSGNCIPRCNYEPWRGAGFLAHRTDCTMYYYYDGIATIIAQQCQPGHFFNGLNCDSTDENDCCDPCLVFCDESGRTVADPLDCTRYYYCAKDNYFPESSTSCPTNENYNFLTTECVPTSTCAQVCTP